jgi:hypothetical protein
VIKKLFPDVLPGAHQIINYTEIARQLFPVQEMPKGAIEFYMDNLDKDKMTAGVDLYHFIDTERNFFLSFQSAIEITEEWHGKVLNVCEWRSLFAAYKAGASHTWPEPRYFDPNECAWVSIKQVEKPKPVWAMTDNFALKLEHPGLVGRVFKAGKPTCNTCYYLDNHKCEHPELVVNGEDRYLPNKEEQKVRLDGCPFNKTEGIEAHKDKFTWSVCLGTGSGEPIASGVVADIKEAISKVEEVFWPVK